MTGALHDVVGRSFVELLGRPAIRDRVVGPDRAAHATLVRTIDTGGFANLELDDDAVRMNVLPVTVDGIDALSTGVVGRASGPPRFALDGDHAEQVARLSDRLGVALPADTGPVTVYHGAAVDRAGVALAHTQQGVVVFHRYLVVPAAIAMVGVAACLVAGAGVGFLLRRPGPGAPSASAVTSDS